MFLFQFERWWQWGPRPGPRHTERQWDGKNWRRGPEPLQEKGLAGGKCAFAAFKLNRMAQSLSSVLQMVVPAAGEHPLQYNYTFWYSRRTPGRPASTQSYEQNIKQIGSFASVSRSTRQGFCCGLNWFSLLWNPAVYWVFSRWSSSGVSIVTWSGPVIWRATVTSTSSRRVSNRCGRY